MPNFPQILTTKNVFLQFSFFKFISELYFIKFLLEKKLSSIENYGVATYLETIIVQIIIFIQLRLPVYSYTRF